MGKSLYEIENLAGKKIGSQFFSHVGALLPASRSSKLRQVYVARPVDNSLIVETDVDTWQVKIDEEETIFSVWRGLSESSLDKMNDGWPNERTFVHLHCNSGTRRTNVKSTNYYYHEQNITTAAKQQKGFGFFGLPLKQPHQHTLSKTASSSNSKSFSTSEAAAVNNVFTTDTPSIITSQLFNCISTIVNALPNNARGHETTSYFVEAVNTPQQQHQHTLER
ncbi:hypothetical protein EVAR_101096_1 [Eumeta japonica]|uniref:Uncharacterized protein n=1 Tax=Eumeta variegata TaxID=151549 RepID=A0A4C1T814_EUMVA|nr:hypothetical protein EVAR_101096_1 [Eumeta japonica]